MADDIEISTDKKLLQIDRIHDFLVNAYWCQGIPKSVLEKAISTSLCFGVYDRGGLQIGFARVVSDYATFAWLCDVYIDEEYRGRGFSLKLMKAVMEYPRLQGLRRICLATKDAHSLYEKFGFRITETPNSWMEIKDNEIYLKMGPGN